MLSLFFTFLSLQIGLGQPHDIKNVPVNNNGQSNSFYKKLFLDDEGFLWYTTYDGFVRETPEEHILFPIDYPDKQEPILTATDFLKTKDGRVFLSSNQGTFIINLNTGKTKPLSSVYPNSRKKIIFSSLKEDSEGNIWIGTYTNYIARYDAYDELSLFEVTEIPEKDNVSLSPKNGIVINDILDDGTIILRQDNRWYSFKNGASDLLWDLEDGRTFDRHEESILSDNGEFFPKDTSGSYEYDNSIYRFTYVPSIDKQIIELPCRTTKIIPDSNSIRYREGIGLFLIDNKIIKGVHIIEVNGDFKMVQKDKVDLPFYIFDVVVDPSGVILASSESGITKIRYTNPGFIKYLDDPKEFALSNNISCRGFSENSAGDLYIYTYAGFFKLKKGDDQFKHLRITEKNSGKPLNNAWVYNFYMQNDDTIWAYGYYHSIIKIDLKTNTYEEIGFTGLPRFEDINYFDIVQLDSDNLLIAGELGLHNYNLKTKEFTEVSWLNGQYDLIGIPIFKLFLDRSKNILWVGTLKNGLFRKNLTTNAVTHFSTESSEYQLKDNNIKVLYKDRDQHIWVGTEQGLHSIHPITFKIKKYTIENGLKNDNITGVLEEGDHIWFGTYNGLVRLHKYNGRIQDFYTNDGLPNNEFNNRSAYKTKDGQMYFGGLNGIVRFDPKTISQRAKPSNIILTNLEIYDQVTKQNKNFKYDLASVKELTMPYNKNYATLRFLINDIFNPEKNSYQYKIDGLTEGWVDLGSYNTVRLFGVPPGDYLLQVRGFSSLGNPTNMLNYKIRAYQIFYKKTWFIVLCIFLFLGAIYFWNYYKRKQMRMRFKHQNKIAQLEAKALRAQMNPHFIFNALNGMQSVMLLKGEKEANRYFAAFSKLLRLTLDMSNSEFILLRDEITYLKSYLELEKLRLNDELEVIFEVDKKMDVGDLMIPCMLFQPIIENAIVHGLTPKKQDRIIWIGFHEEDGMVHGNIIDNGIGREAAAKINERYRKNHKSWATHIMNERIHIFNDVNKKKISFNILDLREGETPLGTQVTIQIPIVKKLSIALDQS
ncbi:histidine kinase [Sungkyunkwania multivorans]|uniref:Histidine kinase n=1 Tax=Sungkyunkwania multivorans TaxID=1173618 RepID=A0ABW3CYA4_9FLAO